MRSHRHPAIRQVVAVALMLGAAACANQQAAPPPAPPVYSFASADEANKALERVEAETAIVEQRYQIERSACYSRFLTTACLDAATDRRRLAISDLRNLEVQAKAWLRKDKADRRDRALAERRAQDERDAVERAEQIKQREAAMERKRLESEQRQRQAQQNDSRRPGSQIPIERTPAGPATGKPR